MDAIDVDANPVLAVQPPSLRATWIRSLQTSSSILDDRSAQLNALVDLISQAQRLLNHKRARCRSAMAPVSALPEEILRIIFPLALDPQPTRRNNMTRLAILGVCQDWRAAALGQQSLWSSSYVSNLRDERALRVALGRYYGDNLKLTLKDVPRAFDTYKLCQVLLPRLEYLEWNASFGLDLLFAVARIDGPLSFVALKTLVIDSPDYCASCSSLEEEIMDLNDIAFPKLEVLELRRMELKEGLDIPTIRELTLFHVTLTARELENLLKSVPNVQDLHLSFAGCFSTDNSDTSTRSIRLPSLKTLSLGWSLHEEAIWFLNHLYAPNLLSLTVKEIEEEEEDDDAGPGVSQDGMLAGSTSDMLLALSIAKLVCHIPTCYCENFTADSATRSSKTLPWSRHWTCSSLLERSFR